MTEKLDILKEHMDELSGYSKDYLNALYSGDFFKEYPTAEKLSQLHNQENAERVLTAYFTDHFTEEFYEFAGKILKKLNLQH